MTGRVAWLCVIRVLGAASFTVFVKGAGFDFSDQRSKGTESQGLRGIAEPLRSARRDLLRNSLAFPQKLILFNRHGDACIASFWHFVLVALDASEATHSQLAGEGDLVGKRQNDLDGFAGLDARSQKEKDPARGHVFRNGGNFVLYCTIRPANDKRQLELKAHGAATFHYGRQWLFSSGLG
jgi:hypothetical protein